jgi:carbon monoxide dehydrogenase subunit G
MEVKLEKRYAIDASIAQVWAVLRDVRAVAGCMPGATITDQIDATHFKGAVKVKVGPALAAFAGDIEVLALDEASQTVQLLGKGADKSGSTASMNLKASIEPGETAGQSVLIGDASVIVNGKFAQFGGRLMVQVSDMILGQFADNFRIAAAAVPVAADATLRLVDVGSLPAPAESAPGSGAATAAALPGAAATTSAAPASTPAPALTAKPAPTSAPTPAPTPAAAPKATTELNAAAIVWMLIKNWFAGLFGKRT